MMVCDRYLYRSLSRRQDSTENMSPISSKADWEPQREPCLSAYLLPGGVAYSYSAAYTPLTAVNLVPPSPNLFVKSVVTMVSAASRLAPVALTLVLPASVYCETQCLNLWLSGSYQHPAHRLHGANALA